MEVKLHLHQLENLKKDVNKMPQVKKPLIKRLIEKAIKEADIKVGSEGTMFTISVEVSNPQSETKLGIRIKLRPKEMFLDPETESKLSVAIAKKLNKSLEPLDMQVSVDTDVPSEDNAIGYFIPLDQIKNMIISSISSKGKGSDEKDIPAPQNMSPKPPSPPKSPLSPDSSVEDDIEEMINEEFLNEMRQRDLNEISKVVNKDDFYNFINAGNNVLRTLEENGMSHINGKKYLGYLVKHNIM